MKNLLCNFFAYNGHVLLAIFIAHAISFSLIKARVNKILKVTILSILASKKLNCSSQSKFTQTETVVQETSKEV